MSFIVRSGYLTGQGKVAPYCNSYKKGELITVPTDYPFHITSFKEVASFIKSYKEADFEILKTLMKSKIALLERKTKLSFDRRQVKAVYFKPPKKIWLPIAPYVEIVSVKEIKTETSEERTLPSTDYMIEYEQEFATLELKNANYRPIEVIYIAGYENKAGIPYQIATSLLHEVSASYKFRNDPNNPAKTSVNGLTVEAYDLLAEGGLIRAYF